MKENKPQNKKYTFQSHSLAATLLLFIYIGIIAAIYVIFINALSEKNCYTDLSASTIESCHTIENNFRNDRSSLRLLSRMIANEKNLYSNEVNNFLTSYDVNTLISNIAILTPDNNIIQSRQHNNSADGIMDFAVESKLGEHISELRKSSIIENSDVMYSFIPIRSNGKTIGMLFTELNPTSIANAWSPEMYDHKASFCIIRRETGEIIVNDWNKNIKNISDLNNKKLEESIKNGESGFQEIKSDNTEQFVSYMPMELENWEIAFFISKDVVFASANEMHNLMKLFLLGILIGFILFILWILWSNRSSIANAEKTANIDVLTGLQNRNRYEKVCKTLKNNSKNITCIYIDANGLHDINNTKGHLAGDQMLRFIADTLKVAFGDEMLFRIGGDEFIVFLKEKNISGINNKLSDIREILKKNDYYASIGVYTADENIILDDAIKNAEKLMYEDKKKYYELIGKDVRNKINQT